MQDAIFWLIFKSYPSKQEVMMLGIFAESLMMAVRLSAPLRGEDFARLKREDEDYIRQRRAALGR